MKQVTTVQLRSNFFFLKTSIIPDVKTLDLYSVGQAAEGPAFATRSLDHSKACEVQSRFLKILCFQTHFFKSTSDQNGMKPKQLFPLICPHLKGGSVRMETSHITRWTEYLWVTECLRTQSSQCKVSNRKRGIGEEGN